MNKIAAAALERESKKLAVFPPGSSVLDSSTGVCELYYDRFEVNRLPISVIHELRPLARVPSLRLYSVSRRRTSFDAIVFGKI